MYNYVTTTCTSVRACSWPSCTQEPLNLLESVKVGEKKKGSERLGVKVPKLK